MDSKFPNGSRNDRPLSDASLTSAESESSLEDRSVPAEDSAGSEKDEAEGEVDPSSQGTSVCCELLSIPSLAPPAQLEERNGKLPPDEKISGQEAQSTVPVRPLTNAVERDSAQLDRKSKLEFEPLSFAATEGHHDSAALGPLTPNVPGSQTNALRQSTRPDVNGRKRFGDREPSVKASMASPLTVENKRPSEDRKSAGPISVGEVKQEIAAAERSDDKSTMDRAPKSKRETHLDRVKQDGRSEQDPSYKGMPVGDSREEESIAQRASQTVAEGTITSTTPSDTSQTVTVAIPTTVLENRLQSPLPLSNQERVLPGRDRGSENPKAAFEVGSSAQRGFFSTSTARETRSTSSSLSPQQEVRLVQRVLRGFEQLANGDGQVKLRLHPPQLGSLQMTLRVEGSQMSAKLEVENALARDALIDNLPQLRQKLSEQGVNIETFEVTIVQSAEDATPSDSPNYDPWSGNTDSNSGQYSNAREERREPSPWENSQLRRQSLPRLGESMPSPSRASQGLDVTA